MRFKKILEPMKFITNLWQIFTDFYPLTSYKFWLNCFSSIKLLQPTLLAMETMEKMVIYYKDGHLFESRKSFEENEMKIFYRWHHGPFETNSFNLTLGCLRRSDVRRLSCHRAPSANKSLAVVSRSIVEGY